MNYTRSDANHTRSEIITSLPQSTPLTYGPPTQVEAAGLWYNLRHPKPLGCFKQLHVALLGEFVGTFLFLFFAYTGVMVGKLAVGGTPSSTGEYLVFLLFAATAFGASLAINVWIFFRVSGGLFNPAVTAAFVLIGMMHPIKGALIVVVQLAAGISAASMTNLLIPVPLSVDNVLAENISVVQGLFLETFLTAELVLAIFMLAVEKHRGTFLAPLGIGLALFMGHMVGIHFTGAGLNPARTLGPAVIQREVPNYHWIYWIGPLLGALIASIFYKMLRIFEYYTANEGQDHDGQAEQLA